MILAYAHAIAELQTVQIKEGGAIQVSRFSL